MSSFNQKVAAVSDVLKANARQRRVTNRQELAEDAAALLRTRGQRKNSNGAPLERYKLVDVLAEVSVRSKDADQVVLPAIVVHYKDSKPGRRFSEWAGSGANHVAEVKKVFAKYGDSYTAQFFANGSKFDSFAEVEDDGPAVDSRDADEGD